MAMVIQKGRQAMNIDIPPERFFEMSRALFAVARNQQLHHRLTASIQDLAERVDKALGSADLTPFNERVSVDLNEDAKEIGHLAGLAWLAHEAGEIAEKETL